MIKGRLLRLARHSLVYGLGGVISRIVAIFLLPIYTSYLTTIDYGYVALLLAAEAVAAIFFRAGIQNAFFRFYYLSNDPARRLTVVRTSFWFTMTSATAGLVLGVGLAPQIAAGLGLEGQAALVRATAVLLWANVNYQQLTALFRAEERSVSYAIASLANVAVTVAATVLLVVVFEQGPLGLIVGNFTGTLAVFLGLLAYRAKEIGFEFDRRLYRAMESFGLPLLPSVLALWATRFSDRFFIKHFLGSSEVGVYSFGVTIASALLLLITAFQLAWPAFAYSIEDDDDARRTYAYVLTYFLFFMTWAGLALSLLSPWLGRLLGGKPEFYPGERFVPLLALGIVIFAGYSVVVIGVGRVRKTGGNWVITGAGALVNVVLNLTLIPRYGAMGAAGALAAAYGTMFLGMCWHAQRLFPVPYQWRRLATLMGVGVALVAAGRALSAPLTAVIPMIALYPMVLFAFGFYQAPERAQLGALLRRVLRVQTA